MRHARGHRIALRQQGGHAVNEWLYRRIADRRIAAGNRAERAGDLPAACRAYRRAVEIAPRYGRAHLNLGIGLEAIGELAPARNHYEQAMALAPRDPYASYPLGKLRLRIGDPGEAS